MNRQPKRKLVWATAAVLTLALIGLLSIDIDQATAERVLPGVDGTTSESGAADSESGTPFSVATPVGSIIKMISALVVVVFCVYAGLYLLKRLMNARRGGNARKGLLEVVQTTYVGPKKTVSLLRVADRSVLIGVTDNGISILTELDADETATILEDEAQPSESAAFGSFLSASAKKIRLPGLIRKPATQES